MKIKIKVTKEVLTATKHCGTDLCTSIVTHCAIAYAVRSIFPGAVVNHARLYFSAPENVSSSDGRYLQYAVLPTSAVDFITDFDDAFPDERVEMNPFSFEVDIPSSIIETIGIGEAYKILSESKTLELVTI